MSIGLADLSSVSVENQSLDVVCVSLQLHELGAGPGIPDPQNLLRRPADYHSS